MVTPYVTNSPCRKKQGLSKIQFSISSVMIAEKENGQSVS
jgi:hypothetical protein